MNTEELKNIRVAVVGGGYGGAATGLALSNLGMNVTVYEQAPALGEVGAGIGLRPETVQFFRDNNAFEAIAAVSSPSEEFRIMDAKGNLIFGEPWPHMNDFPQKNHTRMIHRADFIQALGSTLPEGVLKLNYKLSDIVDNGSTATLTFENGETVEADLVVAADGIRSLVRKQLFSDKDPVFQRTHAYRIVIDGKDAEGLLTDDNLRLYMDNKGTMIYFLPLRHRDQVSFDITVVSEDDTWAPEISTDYLVEKVKDFDERLVRITEKLPIPAITSRSGWDLDSLDNWHSDSTVLIGDAAHAMLWHQGQGANTAVMDAGGLAEALTEAGSVAEALALFQAKRKPITDELQAVSRASWDPDKVETAFPGAQGEH